MAGKPIEGQPIQMVKRSWGKVTGREAPRSTAIPLHSQLGVERGGSFGLKVVLKSTRFTPEQKVEVEKRIVGRDGRLTITTSKPYTKEELQGVRRKVKVRNPLRPWRTVRYE